MATSFIERTRTSIREIAGEPSIHAKYTDARLLTWIEQAYSHIILEINRRSANPIVLPFTIALDADLLLYVLPPTVQRIIDLELLNSDGNTIGYTMPSSRYNPGGPGVTLEHNCIRFWNDPVDGYSLRVWYVPSGCVRLHTGSIASDASIVNSTTLNTCTVVLPATPTTGTLDNRPNAYIGSVFRVLSATTKDYVQERMITAYDVTTRTITVSPCFETALLPGATVVYEIAPPVEQAVDIAVATYVARTLCALEGERDRMATLSSLYQEQIRDLIDQNKWMNAMTEGLKRDSRFARGRTIPSAAPGLNSTSRAVVGT